MHDHDGTSNYGRGKTSVNLVLVEMPCFGLEQCVYVCLHAMHELGLSFTNAPELNSLCRVAIL